MSKRNKTRRLWLNIKFKIPAGVSRETVLRTLIDSVKRGEYTYPEEWKVALGWKNSLFAGMKWGEFTAEMKQSAKSSKGFDLAVLNYLGERK